MSTQYVKQSTAATLRSHQRTEVGCLCGWAAWGHSHAEHQADALEARRLLVDSHLVETVTRLPARTGPHPDTQRWLWVGLAVGASLVLLVTLLGVTL